MPTYDANELSEHDSRETYFYEFVGTTTVRHTNAPISVSVVLDSVAYTFTPPEGGIEHTRATESPQGDRGAIEIKVSHKHPVVTRHKSFPPPGDTTLTIYRQNEIGGEGYQVWTGIVEEIFIDGADASIKCQHLYAVILGGEGLSETFAPECPFQLGHSPCPVPLAAFKFSATVVSVDAFNNTMVVTPGTPQIATFFTAGVAEAANGDKRFILSDTESGGNHTLTLLQSFPSTTVRAGDTVSLYAGDDHTMTTCAVKFGLYTGSGAAYGGNTLQANVNPHQIGRVQ